MYTTSHTHTLLYNLHNKASATSVHFSFFTHTHTQYTHKNSWSRSKEKPCSTMEKVKLKGNGRENGHLISFERDYSLVYGFPWPQRNYKCTFCSKEFKSAQALGGHMNVHRRDRARLRQSPSLDPPYNPNPNPNPNFSTSSSFSASSASSTAVRFVPYTPNLYQQYSLISSRDEERVPLITHSGRDFLGPQLGDVKKKLSMGIMGSNVGDLKGLVLQENGVWKKREILRMGMELELGLKEGLDLELRLGQSNYM